MQLTTGRTGFDRQAPDLHHVGSVHDRTVGSWVLASWVAVVMIVVLPCALVTVTPTPSSSSWLFALAAIAISGARYAWLVAIGQRRLYELTFWVFTYVFLGLAPLVQMRTERTPATAPRVDPSLDQAAMTVMLVGTAVVLIGLSVRLPTNNWMRSPLVVDGVDPTRTVLLALFALGVTAYYVSGVGIATLFSSRFEWLDAVATTWSQGSVAPLATPLIAGGALLVSFIALAKYIMQTRNREWPLIVLTLGVLAGLFLIMLNPITSPRTYLGVAAMAIAAVFGVFAKPQGFRITAVAWVVVLIFVFPLADYFRTPDPAFKASSPVESLISPDFSGFAEINNTLLYVDRFGVTGGRQAVGVALFWFPRRFWPDKPINTTELLASSRGYNFQNLGSPIWSELFINGGWGFLVVGMFLLGVVVRALDRRLESSLQRARAPGVLGCIAPFYFMLLVRGSLLQAMGFLFVLVACSMFVGNWKRNVS